MKPSFREQRVDESGQPKSLTLGRTCVGVAYRNARTAGRQTEVPVLEIQIRPVAGPRDAFLALDAGDGT